jgi:hypothetical protein
MSDLNFKQLIDVPSVLDAHQFQLTGTSNSTLLIMGLGSAGASLRFRGLRFLTGSGFGS